MKYSFIHNILVLRWLLVALAYISLTVIPNLSFAAETDQYTYSCIPLEDSASKINLKLNQILRDVVFQMNMDRNKNLDQIHFLFSYYYYKTIFVDDYGNDSISVFETCINTNSCEGWPYFERIALKPEESIYYKSNYNNITKKYLSSTINACGVRFGTDKLTHLLKDGFRFYYGEVEYGHTPFQTLELAKLSEKTIMGELSTGVYSRADIAADLQGVAFFRDLLDNRIQIKDSHFVLSKEVDICDSVTKAFDERFLPNYYKYEKKIPSLEKAITENLNQCTLLNLSRRDMEEILARKPKPTNWGYYERASVTFKNLPLMLNPKTWSQAWTLKKLNDPLFPPTQSWDHGPKY